MAGTGVEGARIGALLVMLVGLAAMAPDARGDGADPTVRAARQLFAAAEKDEDAGQWGDALEKLRRVAAVKRTAGIRYHVALCEEHLGQLAAALDEYTAASDQARAENAQDVLKLVGKRIADVGPRVPRLTLRVVPEAPGAAVTLDGARVPAAMLGTALPLDPGDHRVEATAADRAAFSQVVTLHERDATTLEVKLLPAPAAPAGPATTPLATPTDATAATSAGDAHAPADTAPPPEPSPDQGSSPTHTAAIAATLGAAAMAGLGGGAYLAAGSAHDSGRTSCAQVVSTDANACGSQRSAVRAWDYTAAGAWVLAAAAASVAVVLWVRAPSVATSARLVLGPGALGLEGRF